MALGGEVANLIVALKLDDSGFSGRLNAAARTLRGFDGSLGRMGRGVGQVGSGLARLGTVAGAAAAGGLTAVVTTAASFEQAFTGVEKTVDASEEQFRQLEEQFRSMARTIPVSFEELAAIGEAGGALGIAREDLLDFTDVVARLAVSTNLSSDQAATALGQLGNVLKLSGDDFRDFSDSLVALGNAGASTETQIVEMAARFGAAGNSAGLTKEEILALSSAVASMGIEVEAGGSALSRIFNSVATNIGTSSDKAQAFAEALGLSAREFKTAWEEDALGTFQDFLAHLNTLDQFEAANLLKKVGITNTRDVNTVRLMGQNVGFVSEQLKIANDAQGELNEESQKFFDTTQGQWQVLKNNLRDVGVTIGNEVLPITKDLITEFTTFLNDPETRRNLQEFGQNLAEGIRGFVAELKGTDFSGLLGGLRIAADAAKVAFDAFRALPAPLQGAIVAAIALNKVSGGGVSLLARGLGNIALGGAGGLARLFGGMRGQTPATPMFVSMVGPGALGGLPGGGRGSFLSGALKVFIIGAAAKVLADTAFDLVNINDPKHQSLTDPTRGFRGTNIPSEREAQMVAAIEALRERAESGDVNAQRQTAALETALAELRSIKQNTAITVNGRPAVAGPPSPQEEALFQQIGQSIYTLRTDAIRTLREGDINAARHAQRQADRLEALRGSVDNLNYDIIPHLGRTNRALAFANRNLGEGNRRQREIAQKVDQNRKVTGTGFQRLDGTVGRIPPKLDRLGSALSIANRNLDEGNSRQREIADRVREQRDALRSGFDRNNAQLGIIARKDFSPRFTANVVTSVTAHLSTYSAMTQITRASTVTNSGFTPTLLNG